MPSNNKMTPVLVIGAIVVAVIVIVSVMNMPDTRTTGEKVGDAIDEMSNGVQDAGRQLEDRTPAERLGDAIEDAGDDIERATH